MDVHAVPREDPDKDATELLTDTMKYLIGAENKLRSRPAVVYLPQTGQVVRIVAQAQAPKEAWPNGVYISKICQACNE